MQTADTEARKGHPGYDYLFWRLASAKKARNNLIFALCPIFLLEAKGSPIDRSAREFGLTCGKVQRETLQQFLAHVGQITTKIGKIDELPLGHETRDSLESVDNWTRSLNDLVPAINTELRYVEELGHWLIDNAPCISSYVYEVKEYLVARCVDSLYKTIERWDRYQATLDEAGSDLKTLPTDKHGPIAAGSECIIQLETTGTQECMNLTAIKEERIFIAECNKVNLIVEVPETPWSGTSDYGSCEAIDGVRTTPCMTPLEPLESDSNSSRGARNICMKSPLRFQVEPVHDDEHLEVADHLTSKDGYNEKENETPAIKKETFDRLYCFIDKEVRIIHPDTRRGFEDSMIKQSNILNREVVCEKTSMVYKACKKNEGLSHCPPIWDKPKVYQLYWTIEPGTLKRTFNKCFLYHRPRKRDGK